MTAPNETQIPPLLWSPPSDTKQETELYKFINFINNKHNLKITDYNQLYLWSVTFIPEFWASVWEFTNIVSYKEYDQVLDETLKMDTIPKWFQGALLNYSENILKWADIRGDEVAIYGSGEGQGQVSKLTWTQLKEQVKVVAHRLKQSGVGRGDRVVGYISNCPEAIIAMLATTSLGAIWSSTSPDFGPKAVLDRFSQIEPKVLFTVNAIVYNGKTHDHLKKLSEVIQNLPTLEKVIVIPFVPSYTMDLSALNYQNALAYTDLFTLTNNEIIPELIYEQVPFDHPVYILFSSGTTGVPKCLVHSVGGMIIQHKKEHQLHGNLGPKDILLQYTTAGWMMWNWLIGGLLVGSSIVTYDGSPFRPDPFVLFRLMEEVGVTAFGTSAKYIQSLQDQPLIPKDYHKLPTLHSIYSTGSPLKPEDYEYVYKSIHSNVCLGSITGGTDICSLFGAHSVDLPVYRGEIQCIGLGMKVESWSHSNTPVFDIPGDLVCTAPFPCMPVYLWNDPDNVKYRAAYFDTFPGVWCQGDYVQIGGQTGGLLMLGRSDGTLNPSGVRFGSAEIYNTLDIFSEIEDSVVIGQKIKDDERVILFIKTKEGFELNQDLITRIKTHIRQLLSPRHVPSIILPTKDIPYTVNGKKVEVAVKKIINGYPLDKVEKGTLINPDSLTLYHNLPELQL